MYSETSCRLCLKDLEGKGINCLKIPEIKTNIELLFSVKFTEKDSCVCICESCFENVMAFKAFNNTINQSQKLIQDYNEIKRKVLITTTASTSNELINLTDNRLDKKVNIGNTEIERSSTASNTGIENILNFIHNPSNDTLNQNESDKILYKMNNIINNELKKRQSLPNNIQESNKIANNNMSRRSNQQNVKIPIEQLLNNSVLQSSEIQSSSIGNAMTKLKKCKVICKNFELPKIFPKERLLLTAKKQTAKHNSTLKSKIKATKLRPVPKSKRAKSKKIMNTIKLNTNTKTQNSSKSNDNNRLFQKSIKITEQSGDDNDFKNNIINERRSTLRIQKYSQHLGKNNENVPLTIIPLRHIKQEATKDIILMPQPLPNTD